MRIFVDAVSGDKCVLTGENHRHVSFALRSKVGDSIVLCPQNGYDYMGVIEKITSDKTFIRIIEKKPNDSEPRVQTDVYFGIMNKGEKMDLTVQKLTELGVCGFYPMLTRYVQAKAESVRLDRLNKISTEAAKQCGRGVIPVVHPLVSFDEMLLNLHEYDLIVFPYEREKKLSLKQFLKENRERATNDDGCIKRAAVIIGSEGGFCENEAEKLLEVGVKSVTLGNRILRAETANIAVVSAMMYELNEWER